LGDQINSVDDVSSCKPVGQCQSLLAGIGSAARILVVVAAVGLVTGATNLASGRTATRVTDDSLAALGQRQVQLSNPPGRPTATDPMATSPGPDGQPSFIIFFEEDQATVAASAQQMISQAAQRYRAKGSTKVMIVGHDDTSKDADSAMALSQRRADAIGSALVAVGIPADSISVAARGKSQLLVPTADGVRDAQNRRVEVFLK
jgi:outer membrane protein OmpA-like peptidoglycan-associated protein